MCVCSGQNHEINSTKQLLCRVLSRIKLFWMGSFSITVHVYEYIAGFFQDNEDNDRGGGGNYKLYSRGHIIYIYIYCPPKESDHHENGGLYQQKRGITEPTHLQVGSQKYLKLIVNYTLTANKNLLCFDLSF